MAITLGKRYRSKVTHVEGVAQMRHEYLNGCVSISLEPGLDNDGKVLPSVQVFENLLEECEGEDAGAYREVPTPTEIVLGRTYRNKLHGFEGVAVTRSEHLSGYNHVGIQPTTEKPHKLPKSFSFDEDELVEASTGREVATSARSGAAPTRAPRL